MVEGLECGLGDVCVIVYFSEQCSIALLKG